MAGAAGVVVDLGDGRALAADDVGDPAGVPVLYLHGSPDCRLARHPDDGVAAALGVRLVAVDRPGYGGSDPQRIPDVLAWADDVARLLDHLAVGRCRIAAWSAGAPWAFGLAARLSDQVEAVVTYGAVAPLAAFADPEVVAASGPRAGVVEELAAGASVGEVAEAVSALLVPPSPVDLALARELITDAYSPRTRAAIDEVPGLLDQLANSFIGAIARHGAAGLTADVMVQFTDGAEPPLARVSCPVVLAHGQHDPIAGPAVGAWLAARLPKSRVAVWDHGHQGLLLDWERWLRLAAAAP